MDTDLEGFLLCGIDQLEKIVGIIGLMGYNRYYGIKLQYIFIFEGGHSSNVLSDCNPRYTRP